MPEFFLVSRGARRTRPPRTPPSAYRASLWLARSCYTVAVVRGGRGSLVLQAVEVFDRALILHLAGVEGDVDLGGQRFGAVLDAARDDDELTGADVAVAVAQLHAQAAGHDEEQLVLGVVMVPDELATQLDDLHVHVVHVADDLR